jgi:tetratricopeptide (TPR) repeat protein
LRLRIRAHEANALRVQGELRSAAERFQQLTDRLDGAEPPALAVSAELASLEASLRNDQRQLERAEALLARAARFYRWAEDQTGLVKVEIKRALILLTAGEWERAIPCFEAAAGMIDSESDPQLAFNAYHNLVLCLCAVGRTGAAVEALGGVRALARRLGDPSNHTFLDWAEGRVAASLGNHETAIGHLRSAREMATSRARTYDAALIGLDLAEVHLARGETAEVKRLAQQMAAAFAAREVAREAARAVAMFAAAAAAEVLTFEAIARARAAFLRAGTGALPAVQPGSAKL